MSFKRDGDDANLLKTLQHRRVSEILGDHIPDDEAKLLSNGRLTCTVCSKRPIFDTIQMLSIHRKGKNHLYELSKCLQYRRDLELRKTKQIQRTGESASPVPDTKDPSLTFITFSSNFSNRAKKKRYSNLLHDRKLVLDITETCEKIKNHVNTAEIIVEQSANSQVRHYLKSLSRKRPLEKTINKLRENYGQAQKKPKQKTEESSEKNNSKNTDSPAKEDNKKAANYEMKLLEAGWIKDASGSWVKDPNVEFDSDEDEPPVF